MATTLNISADGTSSTVTLDKECEYRVKLRGTLAALLACKIQLADLSTADWEDVRMSPDGDPIALGTDFRTCILAGGMELRIITTDFGASADVTIEVSEYGRADNVTQAREAIVAEKVLTEDEEYTVTNSATGRSDQATFST